MQANTLSSLLLFVKVTAELADLRDNFVNVAKEKLSDRQVLMLSTGAAVEESLLVDPSIRGA